MRSFGCEFEICWRVREANMASNVLENDRFSLSSQTDANGDETQFEYDLVGNLTKLTDAALNTTTWSYDGLNRATSETNESGDARLFEYDLVGNLIRSTDRNDREIEYVLDDLYRVQEEKWYDAADQLVRTIETDYDVASQMTRSSDPDHAYDYVYDGLGRVERHDLAITGLADAVTLNSQYDLEHNRTQLAAKIGTTDDFVNDYVYDNLYRVTQITQQGQAGGHAVAEKSVDYAYDLASQMTGIERYADLAETTLVASSTYDYDQTGRLAGLTHSQGATILADYDWTFDAANRITQFVSLADGATDYNYDDRNQLLGADYAGDWQADEGYVYDENGNRITATGSTYETGLDNRLTSDGTFNYVYDGEGNRTARFTDVNDNDLLDSGDTDITEYAWDHRNRLISVTDRDVFGGQSTQVVTHTYDGYDQWLTRTVDPDGDSGTADLEKTVFVHDDGQIVLQFDGTGAGDLTAADLTHRYLWGPGIDQLVADEQIDDVLLPGEVLWALADHQGTVRDVVDENGTVRVHLQYDAFGVVTGIDYFDSAGNPISEGDAEAVEWFIRHTGLYFDDSTGLLQNRARWRDLETNQFLSEDPIKDGHNWRIYVGNSPMMYTDPSGLYTWGDYWVGVKAGAHELFVNQIYGGVKSLVTGEAGRALGERGVGIVESQTGKSFTGTFGEYCRFGRGVAGDITGVNPLVEAGYGFDISNGEQLSTSERIQRGAGGTAALAGTAAGGITAAGRLAPKGPLSHILDGHGPGQGFSGVFDPKTGTIRLAPNKAVPVRDLPDGFVPRQGGHGALRNRLAREGVNVDELQGFTAIIDDAGEIRLEFFSRSVNGRNPNFPGNTLPENLQGTIRDTFQKTTGRTPR